MDMLTKEGFEEIINASEIGTEPLGISHSLEGESFLRLATSAKPIAFYGGSLNTTFYNRCATGYYQSTVENLPVRGPAGGSSLSWTDYLRDASVSAAVALVCLWCGPGVDENPTPKVHLESLEIDAPPAPVQTVETLEDTSIEELYPELDLDRIRQGATILRQARSDAAAVSQVVGRAVRPVHQYE
ncbi:MAG: hypothetical protein ACTHKT_10795 [Solirubrobacterales bacterium]